MINNLKIIMKSTTWSVEDTWSGKTDWFYGKFCHKNQFESPCISWKYLKIKFSEFYWKIQSVTFPCILTKNERKVHQGHSVDCHRESNVSPCKWKYFLLENLYNNMNRDFEHSNGMPFASALISTANWIIVQSFESFYRTEAGQKRKTMPSIA